MARFKNYSSVTLPVGLLEYIDQIVLRTAEENLTEVGEVPDVPSRRKIVQDAIHLLLHEVYPDMLREYRLTLEELNHDEEPSYAIRKYLKNKKIQN